MKVRYRRTGGIANLKIAYEFDADSLPEKHLATLKALLKAKSLEKPTQSDDFIHELEVIDGVTQEKRRFTDSQLPRMALALFDYIVHTAAKKNTRS